MLRPTPIDQLRQPHPDQERIDAESVRLLRETVARRLDRIPHRPQAPALRGPRIKLGSG
jgi:hypothetical protein